MIAAQSMGWREALKVKAAGPDDEGGVIMEPTSGLAKEKRGVEAPCQLQRTRCTTLSRWYVCGNKSTRCSCSIR